MNVLIVLLELCSYIFFSLLMGHVVLLFVSDDRKPAIQMSKPWLLISILGIILCSLGPVLQVVAHFNGVMSVSETLMTVITDFQVGKAWLVISWVSIFLWFTTLHNGSRYLQAFWMLCLITAVGYASHVASLSFVAGWAMHSIHLLSVTLWAGVLLHVSWFAKDGKNLHSFLKWFSTFAAICMAIILSSGFAVMLFVVDVKDYVNSWVLSYGQTLLLKHLSIIPLLALAFVNMYLTRKGKKGGFNPFPFLRAESILFFIVIGFTGLLGTLSPPHNIDFTVDSEGAAKWAQFMAGGTISSPVHLTIQSGQILEGVSLITFSIAFLGMLAYSIRKKASIVWYVLFSVCFIASAYFGLNRLYL
ncbi:hypothetical protein ELQ35_18025 [Peribacillus cavernae]|uniref:Copper resistance protein D domain-containing protein n=1 Tax=Peribacillus cavernae TaxID=1674310 RepID=A0A3S0VJE6_9BACI|nr:CopD family protein [Peribacillus cavernae]MDQ0219918.1 putative copper resistance protein D [Peribacillus cavernae]RUQ26600.1 hypothetical protein ELQ35_18025 [Peribacillus cavernae]